MRLGDLMGVMAGLVVLMIAGCNSGPREGRTPMRMAR